MDPSRGEEGSLQESMKESVDPVKLSVFSNITGQLVAQGAYEAYTDPEFIGEKLVQAESSNEDNTQENGLTPIDEEALTVAEGQEYPSVKFGEDYIQVPGSQKRGMRCALTKEAIFFDRTGKLAEHAAAVGKRVGLSKEHRILRIVLGIDNNHVRQGVARDTYVASADPRINKNVTGLELLDYTDLDTAIALFEAYTDDRAVGEPILVNPKTLLVPISHASIARRTMGAVEIVQAITGDGVQNIGNPYAGKFELLTSPWISWLLDIKGGLSASQASKRWYLGEPKKAFRYRTLFPFAVTSAALANDEFERDVVAQWKASERGVAYSRAPWFMAMMGAD